MWEIQARCLSQSKRVAATAVGIINLSPNQIWELLTLPEGADTFKVEGRKLGADDGCGRWDEQVVFTAAVRVLFWKTLARTRVHQDIDASNPEHVRVSFRLLQSDLMSHLTGQWELQQLAAAGPGTPAVTKVTYTFEMWPKGVPSGLRFMPGLMEAVKGAVRREVAQLLDKVHYVASKVRPGVSVRDALLQVSAECNASGGSFKLLQQALTTTNSSSSSGSGSDVEFGTAAAAGAAAPTANTVQCHALVDDFEVDSEDADDDDMVELGSECYSDADGAGDSSSPAELSSSTAAVSSSSSSSSFMECEDAAEEVGSSNDVAAPVEIKQGGSPASPSSSSSSSSSSGRVRTASDSSHDVDASVEVTERLAAVPGGCANVEELVSKLSGLPQGPASAAVASQQHVPVMV